MHVVLRARLVALAIPLALVLAACGDDEDPVVGGGAAPTTAAAATTAPTGGGGTGTTATTAGTVVSITVRGGSVDGPSRQRVTLNQPVTIRVTSDVAEEVHVHGYDRTAPVGPNQPAELTFTANIPGTFEVELERSHRRLTTLEVQP